MADWKAAKRRGRCAWLPCASCRETVSSPTQILDARGAAIAAAVASAARLVPAARPRGGCASFLACGRRIDVPITFTADGESGASYTIDASEANLVD